MPEPAWLDTHPAAKQVGRPAAALISTDHNWMRFMRLRIDRVLPVTIEGTQAEVLKHNNTKLTFPAPAKWTAPYNKYNPTWYNMFVPSPKGAWGGVTQADREYGLAPPPLCVDQNLLQGQ